MVESRTRERGGAGNRTRLFEMSRLPPFGLSMTYIICDHMTPVTPNSMLLPVVIVNVDAVVVVVDNGDAAQAPQQKTVYNLSYRNFMLTRTSDQRCHIGLDPRHSIEFRITLVGTGP